MSRSAIQAAEYALDTEAAPGTEPIREKRDMPPRHIRWMIAGATVGFILGMGAMEALS